jgi:hypothetical protein
LTEADTPEEWSREGMVQILGELGLIRKDEVAGLD